MRGIEGGVIGHQPLGVVEEVGSAVVSVKKGDRITVPKREAAEWSHVRVRCGRLSGALAHGFLEGRPALDNSRDCQADQPRRAGGDAGSVAAEGSIATAQRCALNGIKSAYIPFISARIRSISDCSCG